MAAARQTLVRLHRWAGLLIAVFLFIAGLSGAIIAWDHELDGWLNPEFFARPQASAACLRSGAELAGQLQQAHPDLLPWYVSVASEPGASNVMFVQQLQPGQPPTVLQVALDPCSGELVGRREWGVFAADRLHLMPFIYRLHYSLHLPAVGGFETGILLLGGVAIVWLIDSVVALWLAIPKLSQWRKSLMFRWRQGTYKLVFDVHRSGGVWIWGLLVLLAFSSVSMNLREQLVLPVVNALAPVTPIRAEHRAAPPAAGRARLPLSAVVGLARSQAARLGWQLPVGGVFYMQAQQVYKVGFFEAGGEHGAGPFGNDYLYLDAFSGELLDIEAAAEGSAGDLFMRLQFPLHSGRILGLPGRIVISLTGLLVAVLSLSGIWIWYRKRRARLSAGRA